MLVGFQQVGSSRPAKMRKSRPRRANPTGDKTDIGIGILEAAKMRHLVLDRSQGIDCEGKAGTRRNMID